MNDYVVGVDRAEPECSVKNSGSSRANKHNEKFQLEPKRAKRIYRKLANINIHI